MNIQWLWSVMQGYTDGLSMAEVLRIPLSIPKPLYYVGWLLKVLYTRYRMRTNRNQSFSLSSFIPKENNYTTLHIWHSTKNSVKFITILRSTVQLITAWPKGRPLTRSGPHSALDSALKGTGGGNKVISAPHKSLSCCYIKENSIIPQSSCKVRCLSEISSFKPWKNVLVFFCDNLHLVAQLNSPRETVL